MKHWKYLCFWIIGLACLQTFIMTTQIQSIEMSISERVVDTLEYKGLHRVETIMLGRDVVLTGDVSSPSANKNALRSVESVYGVRNVTSKLNINPLRLPHFRIIRDEHGIVLLQGELPSQKLVNQLAELVSKNIDHVIVVNEVFTEPEVTNPAWLEIVPGVLAEANQLVVMELEMGAGRLSIGGLLGSASDYKVMISRIEQFISSQGFQFVNKIGVHQLARELKYSEQLDTDVREVSDAAVSNEVVEEEVEEEVEQETVEEVDQEVGVGNTLSLNSEISSDVPQTTEMEIEVNLQESENAEVKPVVEDVETEALKMAQCQEEINDFIRITPIIFSTNSIELNEHGYNIVRDIALILDDCPVVNVNIHSHTDSSGNAESNLELSAQRAISVMNALNDLGVSESRLLAQGFGELKPIESNNSQEGSAKNRRIEIILERSKE